MIQTVRVINKNENEDLRGKGILSELASTKVSNVRSVRVYRLEGVSPTLADKLAQKLLSEDINQAYALNKPVINGGQKVEIAYKPGVMNPEVASIIKAARDLGIKLMAADASWEYYFYGKTKKEEIVSLAQQLNLLNQTVEYIVDDEPKTLLIKPSKGHTAIIPLRKMSEEELMTLSKDKLFLNLEEMKVVQNYFQKMRRDPTDCELETLAQTWSEHCAHKTFKAELIVDGKKKEPLIKRLQKEALKHDKNIVSAFVDNSGVLEFYDGMSICGKVETHNSPSAIEPYGGAMTGSGGVFRDILGTGLGGKTIASTDMFCFAPVDLKPDNLPPGCLPPEYLLKRVVTGVRDYGNRMGIPTNNGSVHFHPDFRAKPTIIVGAYGTIPTRKAKKRKAKVGEIVVAIGGKTGRDGIHGATFSSGEMSHRTISVNSSAVQIGNAIEEKRMFDALIEARDLDLIASIQDCGAGGFSSAIGEMGETIGVKVDLAKAPLKYQGLSPWEIWISESQERMVVAVDKTKLKKFIVLCDKYNVETAVLGKFDGSKKLRVYYGKELVCNLDMKFLHHGLPQRTMTARRPENKTLELINQSSLSLPPKQESRKKYWIHDQVGDENKTRAGTGNLLSEQEWVKILQQVVSHGNVCSKEPIIRQYDHTVQGTNVMPPFAGLSLQGPMDAAVVRPLLNKPYGMIISHGLNPVLNNFDAYLGSLWAGVEALANYVSVGGDYKQAGLINNYIWPFPDEESLWTLDRSVDAVVDIMKAFKIPVISGKDSLSSTYRGPEGEVIKIPPVLCMSVFGKIPDVSRTITTDFKQSGSAVYLIGQQDVKAMAGSVYAEVSGLNDSHVPTNDLQLLTKVFANIHHNIKTGSLLACHDISEGGLITTLFEMCVGGELGVAIDLSNKEQLDYSLFNETVGCFVVEVESKAKGEKLFKNIPHTFLGNTTMGQLISIKQNKKSVFHVEVEKLKKSWQKPMVSLFGTV